MSIKFKYMGKSPKIDINESGNKATITIDRKKFEIHKHTGGKPEDNYIQLWMCPNAYVMTETPEKMARHIIHYWHQFT